MSENRLQLIERVKEDINNIPERFLNEDYSYITEILSVLGSERPEMITDRANELKRYEHKVDGIINDLSEEFYMEFRSLVSSAKPFGGMLERTQKLTKNLRRDIKDCKALLNKKKESLKTTWYQSLYNKEILSQLTQVQMIAEDTQRVEGLLKNRLYLKAIRYLNEARDKINEIESDVAESPLVKSIAQDVAQKRSALINTILVEVEEFIYLQNKDIFKREFLKAINVVDQAYRLTKLSFDQLSSGDGDSAERKFEDKFILAEVEEKVKNTLMEIVGGSFNNEEDPKDLKLDQITETWEESHINKKGGIEDCLLLVKVLKLSETNLDAANKISEDIMTNVTETIHRCLDQVIESDDAEDKMLVRREFLQMDSSRNLTQYMPSSAEFLTVMKLIMGVFVIVKSILKNGMMFVKLMQENFGSEQNSDINCFIWDIWNVFQHEMRQHIAAIVNETNDLNERTLNQELERQDKERLHITDFHFSETAAQIHSASNIKAEQMMIHLDKLRRKVTFDPYFITPIHSFSTEFTEKINFYLSLFDPESGPSRISHELTTYTSHGIENFLLRLTEDCVLCIESIVSYPDNFIPNRQRGITGDIKTGRYSVFMSDIQSTNFYETYQSQGRPSRRAGFLKGNTHGKEISEFYFPGYLELKSNLDVVLSYMSAVPSRLLSSLFLNVIKMANFFYDYLSKKFEAIVHGSFYQKEFDDTYFSMLRESIPFLPHRCAHFFQPVDEEEDPREDFAQMEMKLEENLCDFKTFLRKDQLLLDEKNVKFLSTLHDNCHWLSAIFIEYTEAMLAKFDEAELQAIVYHLEADKQRLPNFEEVLAGMAKSDRMDILGKVLKDTLTRRGSASNLNVASLNNKTEMTNEECFVHWFAITEKIATLSDICLMLLRTEGRAKVFYFLSQIKGESYWKVQQIDECDNFVYQLSRETILFNEYIKDIIDEDKLLYVWSGIENLLGKVLIRAIATIQSKKLNKEGMKVYLKNINTLQKMLSQLTLSPSSDLNELFAVGHYSLEKAKKFLDLFSLEGDQLIRYAKEHEDEFDDMEYSIITSTKTPYREPMGADVLARIRTMIIRGSNEDEGL
eukprot:CAMPEP_0115011712 /NCGR_PEP_ID=MMETSP0216-20121206/24227_1 /TAXON_ID=223996 /ORGANISM="Protocruzia adherens, Strain Boccale" /LENGTH=1081 /DNA_ID=CAMNT_0002380475 /DNA_START=64 /DNA_END=3309 /DNA_ORIENTATION=-